MGHKSITVTGTILMETLKQGHTGFTEQCTEIVFISICAGDTSCKFQSLMKYPGYFQILFYVACINFIQTVNNFCHICKLP